MDAANKESSAISRGCFAYKGKRKRLKLENYLDTAPPSTGGGGGGGSGEKDSGSSVISEADFARGKWVEARSKSLRSLLDRLETEGESKLKKEMHSKLFGAVCEFIDDQASRLKIDETDAGAIPTGAMVLGVNMPDHQLAMSTLKEMITKDVSSHVVSLNSNGCGNIRTAMAEIVSQLMPDDGGQATNLDTSQGGDADDDDAGYAISAKRRKTTLCTMPVLSAWYREMVPDRAPVVVVFEDLEGFDAGVLERIILSCSGHHGAKDIPFVFLFCIATSVTTVHHLLSHSVSGLLAIQTFQAPLAVDYLSSLIDQTLLAPDFPFKLGPRIFAFLREVFHYHDFSVANFIAGLQVCLMEHFLGNPVSYLCCEKGEIVRRAQSLNKDDLELFRSLPSFKDHFDSIDADAQSGLSRDAVFRGFLQSKLLLLHNHHDDFLIAVRLLFGLGRHLPKRPLGQRLHALYETHLKVGAKDCPTYAHVIQLLRMLSKDDLVAKLGSLLDEIRLLGGGEGRRKIGDLVARLVGFVERLVDDDDAGRVDEDADSLDSASSTTSSLSFLSADKKGGGGGGGGGAKKGLKLHELKASLQNQMAAKTPALSKFEKLRKEVVDALDAFFLDAIVPPKKTVFHEVAYFDRHQYLKEILNPAPRASISNALAQPGRYLECECCKGGAGDKERILATYPDVSIAYKLHLECPRYINLYDWLQAFVQVVRAKVGGNDESDTKKPDPVLQARFIRAVSELQFLGFIGPTSKKTDHVIRLTWGSG